MSCSVLDDCQFCIEGQGEAAGNGFAGLLTDFVAAEVLLTQNEKAFAIPSIGALVPGHILILPKGHYFNVAAIPDEALQDLENLAIKCYGTVERVFGAPVIAFEHGSFDGSTRSGACLEHAHLHILPLLSSMRPPEFEGRLRWHRVAEDEDLVISARRILSVGKSYMSLWDGDAWWLADASQAQSQDMRKAVAQAIGSPDRWDWALFPNVEEIEATINSLRPSEVWVCRDSTFTLSRALGAGAPDSDEAAPVGGEPLTREG